MSPVTIERWFYCLRKKQKIDRESCNYSDQNIHYRTCFNKICELITAWIINRNKIAEGKRCTEEVRLLEFYPALYILSSAPKIISGEGE